MEKIDINKIRGHWVEIDSKYENLVASSGDDTIESIKMVAEKVNEIIEYLTQDNK